MQDIGATTYRFSVAWPRTFPEGTGQPNPKSLDFYHRLVDALLEAGIEPFATLYHWDLPQTLQDRHGGWQSKDTAKAFADYAGYVAEQLGDRVKHYFTINEFASFVEGGYQGVDVQVGGARPSTWAPPRGCGCRMPASPTISAYLASAGGQTPRFTDEELATIAYPLEFWAPRQMQSIWDARSIFITEHGCAAADVVADDGRVQTATG
jgi:hypothetical protein